MSLVKGGIAAILVAVIGVAFFNYTWALNVTDAAAKTQVIAKSTLNLVETHLVAPNIHVTMTPEGLPIYPTRSEHEELKKILQRIERLQIAVAIKAGVSIENIIKEE